MRQAGELEERRQRKPKNRKRRTIGGSLRALAGPVIIVVGIAYRCRGIRRQNNALVLNISNTTARSRGLGGLVGCELR